MQYIKTTFFVIISVTNSNNYIIDISHIINESINAITLFNCNDLDKYLELLVKLCKNITNYILISQFAIELINTIKPIQDSFNESLSYLENSVINLDTIESNIHYMTNIL
jgi:hypothetical protein